MRQKWCLFSLPVLKEVLPASTPEQPGAPKKSFYSLLIVSLLICTHTI